MTADIPPHFQLAAHPIADPEAIVRVSTARFTVLTSRLIRIEYDPDEQFVDRASQVFWNRKQPVPSFQFEQDGDHHSIITEHLHLRYTPDADGFSPENLSIRLREDGTTWRYGDGDPHNLKGTVRTLDKVSGAAKLEAGLLSRSGWVVVDDSNSLIFEDSGWIAPREINRLARDLYFFGYGLHHLACLQDFFKLAGATPLLPRWALGNWWSRFWEYTQDELQALVSDFRHYNVPLSVCIVDMDWHVTDTGNASSGWTGYTWNRTLFPQPRRLLSWLHAQGLRTALNLHPAEGIHPHEEDYEQMAQALNIDPESGEPAPFNIADPNFTRHYFEILHHPQEEAGVDFWWMDWQQGTLSALPALDPLWWLNHLHFLDLARKGKRRPMIFSRWGGLGNHRYPVGFSGDTVVDWSSLAFQPYQTATAANVGFGWWSHDIGGHMQGVEEPELFARWVQFGVFSPIMRLHSTKNPYHERRPWRYDADTFQIARQALQLRHKLIPYLYTMSWLNHVQGLSPIRPLYHDYPQHEAAYHCCDQYTFGSELIVAPFVTPADGNTRHSRQLVWFPPGEWFHFFDGRYFEGDRWQAIYGMLDEIPVLARAGAIVPLAAQAGWGQPGNPEALDVFVFAGDDNVFELYEDDGESLAYQNGQYVLTRFEQKWQEDRLQLEIAAPSGKRELLPKWRTFQLHFRGILRPDAIEVQVAGAQRRLDSRYDAASGALQLAPLTLAPDERLSVVLHSKQGPLMRRTDHRLQTVQRIVEAFRLQTNAKLGMVQQLSDIVDDPLLLANYTVELHRSQLQALLETILQAGIERNKHTGEDRIILWNNLRDERVTYQLSRQDAEKWLPTERFTAEQGIAPQFESIHLEETLPDGDWKLAVQLGALLTVTHSSAD